MSASAKELLKSAITINENNMFEADFFKKALGEASDEVVQLVVDNIYNLNKLVNEKSIVETYTALLLSSKLEMVQFAIDKIADLSAIGISDDLVIPHKDNRAESINRFFYSPVSDVVNSLAQAHNPEVAKYAWEQLAKGTLPSEDLGKKLAEFGALNKAENKQIAEYMVDNVAQIKAQIPDDASYVFRAAVLAKDISFVKETIKNLRHVEEVAEFNIHPQYLKPFVRGAVEALARGMEVKFIDNVAVRVADIIDNYSGDNRHLNILIQGVLSANNSQTLNFALSNKEKIEAAVSFPDELKNSHCYTGQDNDGEDYTRLLLSLIKAKDLKIAQIALASVDEFKKAGLYSGDMVEALRGIAKAKSQEAATFAVEQIENLRAQNISNNELTKIVSLFAQAEKIENGLPVYAAGEFPHAVIKGKLFEKFLQDYFQPQSRDIVVGEIFHQGTALENPLKVLGQ